MRGKGSRSDNRHNIWSSMDSANDQRITLKRSNPTAESEGRIKRVREEILHRLMSNLPSDVLHEITKRLSLPDFLSVGHVCSEWRLFFKAARPIYLSCMPPLAMSMKFHGQKTIYFCNMTNGDKYSTKTMHYVKKSFVGISCGFVIMEDRRGIWFANPITGEKLEFLKPSGTTLDITDRAILMKLVPSGDYITVILQKGSQTVQANRLGSEDWTTYSYLREPWHIIDLVVTNGHVLGLMSNGWVGVLLVSASLEFKKYKMRSRRFNDDSKLVVTANGHPMVVEPQANGGFQVFKIDFGTREWVAVNNLGNKTLFTDDRKTYTFLDPKAWGGLTNCVYRLNGNRDTCSVYSVGSCSKIREISMERIPFSYMRSWYFPSTAHKVVHVLVNDQLHP